MSNEQSPLTEQESGWFDTLGAVVAGKAKNWEAALMRATLHGKDVAVIVAVNRVEEDDIGVRPMAILMDDEMFEALEPPEGATK